MRARTAGARSRRRATRAAAPRRARVPRARSCVDATVLVVEVPPLVRRRLRVALGRVLPLLLATERGDVEVGPRAAHGLVAAGINEVGAEDVVALADERVGAVPLAHAEVGVEVVGEGEPGPRPAHPLLPALDVL